MMSNYLVLDTETDGLDWQKDPIVAIGLKNGMINKSIIISNINDIMGLVPSSVHLLVGHNISFDLLFLWGSERLQYMLQQGLCIWDTQLVHYMLSGQQEKYPKLREIATKVYGCQNRIKWIDKLLFENKCAPVGLKVSDLPKEKVLEDVKGDVLDTEQVYLQQVEKVKELNMLPLVQGQMDALLATTEMTYNGFKVDRNCLENNRSLLENELKTKEEQLLNLVERYWK